MSKKKNNIVEGEVLLEGPGDARFERMTYQYFRKGLLAAEFKVFVLDTQISTLDISAEEFLFFGCKGFGRMVKGLFGDWDRLDRLKYPSIGCGRMQWVNRIYWIESFYIRPGVNAAGFVEDIVCVLADGVYDYHGVVILGFYPGVMNLFPVLEMYGFREMWELDERFAPRVGGNWDVRYEMFFSD